MRAPTMIENAKKRSPTISQSAWKLPMPSPTRSNQPSVRSASSEEFFALFRHVDVRTQRRTKGPLTSSVLARRRARSSLAQCRHTARILTPFATLRVLPRRAALQHSHVAEREVVFSPGLSDRSERERAVISSVVFQREIVAAGVEARGSARACGMCVSTGQRRTLGGTSRDQRPRSALRRRPGGQRHPPQVQEEALRAAGAARIGEQVRGAAANRGLDGPRQPPFVADAGAERGERLAEVGAVRGEVAREGVTERAMGALDDAVRRRRAARCPLRERRDAPTRAWRRASPSRRRRCARGGRRGARARRRASRGSSSRCRTRCTRPPARRPLDRSRIAESMHDAHGVTRQTRGHVAMRAHLVERDADRSLTIFANHRQCDLALRSSRPSRFRSCTQLACGRGHHRREDVVLLPYSSTANANL